MRRACSLTTRRRKTRMLRRRRPPSNLRPRRPKGRKARPGRKRRRLSPPNAKTRLDMTLEDRALKICNCNKTIALDAKALGTALKLTQPIQMHTELCRKEVGSFLERLLEAADFFAAQLRVHLDRLRELEGGPERLGIERNGLVAVADLQRAVFERHVKPCLCDRRAQAAAFSPGPRFSPFPPHRAAI